MATGGLRVDASPLPVSRDYLLLFALFLVVRVALAVAFPIQPTSDAAFYYDVGESLAAGTGYTDNGYPSAFGPVGFSFLLALSFKVFGANLAAAYIVNLIGNCAIFWLMLGIGRRVYVPEIGIKLALLVYAIYPNAIVYQTHVLSEVSFTAFLLAGIYVSLGAAATRSWILAGLLFGMAGLIRSTAFPYVLGGYIALWATRQHWSLPTLFKALAVSFAAVMLVQLPWVIRNYNVFGTFILSSTHGGVVLYDGNNEFARGVPTDSWTTPELKAKLEALPVPLSRRFTDPVTFNQGAGDLAKKWIRENPRAFMALMPRKLLALWGKDGEGAWAYERQYPPSAQPAIFAIKLISVAMYVAIILLAIPAGWAGLTGLWRRREQPAQLCHLFLFAILSSMIAAVYFGFSRYHFPAMPTLVLAAGWTVATFLAKRQAKRAESH